MTQQTSPPQSHAGRLHVLDEIRGILIVCMVFYHAFYTLWEIFSFEPAKWLLDFFTPVEPLFAGGFIFIAGLSCQLSRSNLKRGLRLLAVSALLTAATLLLQLFGINQVIWFGILHMLCVSMLLFCLLKPLIERIPIPLGVLICAVLFLITYRIGSGQIGLPGLFLTLPEQLTKIRLLYPIGIHDHSFFSADYFPLFPWLFCFLAGSFVGRLAKDGRFPAFFSRSHCPLLSWIGKRSIVIYILHQPILYGIFQLLFWILC